MIFKDFQQQIKRTLPNLDNKYIPRGVEVQPFESSLPEAMLDIIHMRLGIVSEIEEFISACRKGDKVGMGEELVDMLWYMGNDLNILLKTGYINSEIYNTFAKIQFGISPMATDGGFKLNEGEPGWFSSLVFNTSILCDLLKKDLAYSRTPDVITYVKAMNYLFGSINNLALSNGINLEEFMEKVIIKLRNRYPEKFTEEAAINRDTDAERKILET